jgi:hypothetical protein
MTPKQILFELQRFQEFQIKKKKKNVMSGTKSFIILFFININVIKFNWSNVIYFVTLYLLFQKLDQNFSHLNYRPFL